MFQDEQTDVVLDPVNTYILAYFGGEILNRKEWSQRLTTSAPLRAPVMLTN
ncbi:hypothetical protein G9A89_009183 [Geosiphon pyriformis]|nr:hypothetical protein G9A89_009183 [Geosiphon pyriformis]